MGQDVVPHAGCDRPRQFPLPIYGAVGAFVDGEPLVCGGETADYYEARCWGYDYKDDAWRLKTATHLKQGRLYARGALTYPGRLFVAGGYDGSYLSTGELLEADGSFSTEVLPEPDGSSLGCLVRVSDTQLMLVGGESAYDYLRSAHLYDFERDEWELLPPMRFARRAAACGVTRRRDGGEGGDTVTEVVVAGGEDYSTEFRLVEIFSVEERQWRLASPMPLPVEFASTVQYGDSFLLVGGYDNANDEFLSAIWEYLPEDDDWVLYGRSLGVPRSDTAVIPLPDYVGHCQ